MIIITRRSAPSNLDQAPYGSQCIAQDHHIDHYEIYLQVSKDEDSPNWELLGMFNQQSSQHYIDELISMRLGKSI